MKAGDRSNSEKREAVRTALADPARARLSDRALARACGVSHTCVAHARYAAEAGSSPSCVYFIESGSDGPIKVGHACNVQARPRELQVGNPNQLRLLGTLPGGRELERWFHETFAHARVRGEWFESGVLREYIRLEVTS